MIPASFAQQRLWFLYKLEGPSATYNMPLVLRLTGRLDAAALHAALVDVVARHEPLRTVFTEADGEPQQHILQAADAELGWHTATTGSDGLPAAVREAARYAFDLTAEIPIRAWLFEVDAEEHVLALVMHHIATDGASLGPLARDLVTAYRARSAGRAPDWEPLPVQYADYTLWQRELLGDRTDPDSVYARQLAYWRDRLAGLPDVIELPTDRGRPAVASYAGDTIRFRWDAGLHAAIDRCAREHGATVSMVLLASMAALLTRLGAGTDLALGAPIAGRTEQGLEDLVGCFLNTWVLRADTSGDPSFAELLARVREASLAAYDNQDIPFASLVEELNPARSMAHHPLFQVSLAVQNTGQPDFNLSGLTVRPDPVPTGTARFDLALSLREDAEGSGRAGYAGMLEYATDLYDEGTARELVARWERLLRGLIAEPGRRIGDVPLLRPAERATLLRWGGVEAVAAPGEPVPEAFAAQVARTPDAPALVHNGSTWTYAELDAWSNRLAHHLTARGAGPGATVALVLPRGPLLAAALLGVLKSGAAYLPIDPRHPGERTGRMLADAAPAVVLDTAPDEAGLSADPVAVRVRPDCAAYLLYTSGSTGEPKGVVVTHRNLGSFLANIAERVRVRAGDRLLATTTIGFDIAGLELFLPWVSGATVVLAGDDDVRDPGALVSLLARERVSVTQATPSLWREVAAATGPDGPLSGVDILVGGEALPGDLAARLVGLGRSVTNLYGPTEATIWSTSAPVDGTEPEPTIGRPLTNTRAFVLDARLRLVPPGVPGELYLAGDAIARGYLNRPGLTAQRFPACPFGGPGERMYRTGDLARWDARGRLVFLGRADDQVKLRGFRVELGEVEAVLRADPAVAQAAAAVREDRPGDRRLVGYVVPAGDPATVDPRAIRARAATRLPEYMVPSVLVVLDSLPATANGKLNRPALPAPDYVGTGEAGRAPRSAREDVLCGLYAEVLGVPAVSVDDGFFALGGHSLLATRLVSRIRAALGVELPVRAVFEAPTVAQLAAWHGGTEDGAPTRPPVVRAARPDPLPASFAQQRLWFLHRLEERAAIYNMPLVLRLTGDLDPDALRAALADVVARHESLRTVFAEVDGEPCQRILPEADARPYWAQRTVTDTELPDALAEAARHRFDLAAELPVRGSLFTVGAGAHVLVVVLHHIAADGWSLAPLARDLVAAYRARCAGVAPEWVPLPVQYADYTLWQRDLLGDRGDPASRYSEQLSYWRDQLAGLPEVIDLPGDRPRPPVASHRGAMIRVGWGPDLHAAVVGCARACGATVSMVAHAALAVLLSRLGAGVDVPIGAPIAGRTDEALDDLVGFFVNTWVLRADLSGDPSFVELLGRVRAASLAAYDRQDVPFEHLVEVLNPERSLSHHPLFQVALAVQNSARPRFDLPGLTVTGEPVSTGTARFDLLVLLGERFDEAGAAAGIDASVEFATDLFDADTVHGLMDRWQNLLRDLVGAPERRISELGVLGGAERDRLLAWSRGPVVPVAAANLPELFAAQVRRDPTATALVDGQRRWSYAELDAWSNRIAHELIGRGARPGTRVALLLDRVAVLPAAVLGVLKSGACYVAVDTGYPKERIELVLADTDPVAVLDQAWADQERTGPDTPPAVTIRPGDAAYVIHTSGSTGRPKGVEVSHGNVVQLIEGSRDRFGWSAADVWAVCHSLSFDFSVWELWGAWAHGGTAVLVSREVSRDPARLLDLVQDNGITVLNQTPSAFYALAAADRGRGLLRGASAPRWVIFGGEALDVSRLDTAAGGPGLVNMYGITETTVHVTVHAVDRADGWASPIGVPLPNVRVYVLDDRLRPVAPGVVGEVYVAGAGVARGYVGKPGLTAERFVACPFGGHGERMYRSGDRARWTRDGCLVFAGRADAQVKVRGFRIEPGEIEAVAREHPGVADVAVLLREVGGEDSADRRLVAYAVPDARPAAPEGGQQVGEWRRVYDDLYRDPNEAAFGEDFRGWDSSYTGEPIPLPEMRRWRDATVARATVGRPRRVLEIGVGAGLLLAAIAPGCDEYWATDFSEAVIDRLRGQVATRPWGERVRLWCRPADDLTGLPAGYFDTVLLNSVVQYFPGADYLDRVLSQAFGLLAPGGRIMVGDVRNLGTLTDFHTAVHRTRHPGTRAAAVPAAVARAAWLDTELVLAPEFFTALAARHGACAVDLRLKDGDDPNELTRHRYDVTLHTGPATDLAGLPVLDWSGPGTLDRALEGGAPVRVAGIPNARTAADRTTADRTASDERGIEPACVQARAAERGLCALLTASGADPARFEAVLLPATDATTAVTGLYRPGEPRALANDPAAARAALRLPAQLREYLSTRLPEHLVPAHVITLPGLPLTAHGKLDHAALPAPDLVAPDATARRTVRAPKNDQEAALCRLFAEVLGVAEVTVEDDFFALGGHSLLATRLVSRVRAVLDVELAVRSVFDAPTPARLAGRLDQAAAPRPRLRPMRRPVRQDG